MPHAILRLAPSNGGIYPLLQARLCVAWPPHLLHFFPLDFRPPRQPWKLQRLANPVAYIPRCLAPDVFSQRPVAFELALVEPLVRGCLMREGTVLIVIAPHVVRQLSIARILRRGASHRHTRLDQNQ